LREWLRSALAAQSEGATVAGSEKAKVKRRVCGERAARAEPVVGKNEALYGLLAGA
jgi:hypothetical protein